MTEVRGLSKFRSVSYEQCGVIIRNGIGIEVVEVDNEAEDPTKNYEISQESVVSIHEKLADGEKIMGYFHTHLPHHPAEPSSHDWESARENSGVMHAVYKPSTGELTWYFVE